MPDTDAVGYASTLQGEHAMKADEFRRKARKCREDADAYDRLATDHEQRAAWAGEMAAALIDEEPDGA